MPADITGTDIIQEDKTTGHRELVFEKGPSFPKSSWRTKSIGLFENSSRPARSHAGA